MKVETPRAHDLLTPAEASLVTGASLKAIYKVARERLPANAVVRHASKMFLTREGAICVRLDRELPKEVPLNVRRYFYRELTRRPDVDVRCERGPLVYLLEVKVGTEAVTTELNAYRRALSVVGVDPEVQGGAATFRGTRVLVHHIAHLLAGGADPAELKEDYPNLTDVMLAAAPLYARTHPRLGRPKAPGWRGVDPKSERRSARAAA